MCTHLLEADQPAVDLITLEGRVLVRRQLCLLLLLALQPGCEVVHLQCRAEEVVRQGGCAASVSAAGVKRWRHAQRVHSYHALPNAAIQTGLPGPGAGDHVSRHVPDNRCVPVLCIWPQRMAAGAPPNQTTHQPPPGRIMCASPAPSARRCPPSPARASPGASCSPPCASAPQTGPPAPAPWAAPPPPPPGQRWRRRRP